MSKKPIIVFEGIEGSGKTLHIKNVTNYLNKKKKNLLRLENLVVTKTLKKSENLFLITTQHLTKILIYCYIYQQEARILNLLEKIEGR